MQTAVFIPCQATHCEVVRGPTRARSKICGCRRKISPLLLCSSGTYLPASPRTVGRMGVMQVFFFFSRRKSAGSKGQGRVSVRYSPLGGRENCSAPTNLFLAVCVEYLTRIEPWPLRRLHHLFKTVPPPHLHLHARLAVFGCYYNRCLQVIGCTMNSMHFIQTQKQ